MGLGGRGGGGVEGGVLSYFFLGGSPKNCKVLNVKFSFNTETKLLLGSILSFLRPN